MGRDENAVLAVRICGLAMITATLPVFVWTQAHPLGTPGEALDGVVVSHLTVSFLESTVATICYPLALILLAPLFSKLAAHPAPEAEAAVGEPLRLALLVIGIVYALTLLLALPLLQLVPALDATMILLLSVLTAAVVFLLLWPQPVLRLTLRRSATGPGPYSPRTVIAAGLAIVGLWLGAQAIAQVAPGLGLLVEQPGEFPNGMASRILALNVPLLVMAAALLWWSGPIARRLAGGASGQAAPATALPPSTCLCLAIFLIGCYEVLHPLALGPFLVVQLKPSDTPPLVSFGVLLAEKAVLVVAAAWLIRLVGPRLGRLFYPSETGSEGAQGRGLGILQVGLILISVDVISRGIEENVSHQAAHWSSLLVGLALLAFWAEVSRWFLRQRKTDEEWLPSWRAAALRPWLVLLGFWIGFLPLTGTLAWALERVPWLFPPVVWPQNMAGRPGPPLLWIVGLVLVFAAGPLARWLAFDSVFGRLWSLGWTRRPRT